MFAAFKSIHFQFDMAFMQKHFPSALSVLFFECFFLECFSFAVIRNENSVNFSVSLMIFHQRGFSSVHFFSSFFCHFNEVLDLKYSLREVPLQNIIKTVRGECDDDRRNFRQAEIERK